MSGDPVIKLRGLSKSFGPVRGVSSLDLEVGAGQVFGFLGPNGAGKSTTIRLMMGLYVPTSGAAELFGLDVRGHGPRVRSRIGYLPGDLALYPRLTGREILSRVAKIRGDVDSRLRDTLVERFGAELGRPVHTLSKGNRQKLGLIAAFMHDPELLVLDEPTSGLDPLLQKEFADLLDESVRRGRTVFLSSHDLAEVQHLAHEVAIIRDGEIVVRDTVDALQAMAPRRVELTFRDPIDVVELADVRGCVVTAASGRHVVVEVTGEIGPLLRRVARYDVVDLSARSADLEELFLRYYAEPEPRNDVAH